MSNHVLFEVPELFAPRVYSPLYVEETGPQYGAMFAADGVGVPQALVEHLDAPKWVSALEGDAYRLFGRLPPAVIADGDISTILSCTDAANLSRDLLLRGIPVALRVDLYKLEPNHRRPGRNGAAITAIRVRRDDMLRRYDEICAEFFADPSLPHRG